MTPSSNTWSKGLGAPNAAILQEAEADRQETTVRIAVPPPGQPVLPLPIGLPLRTPLTDVHPAVKAGDVGAAAPDLTAEPGMFSSSAVLTTILGPGAPEMIKTPAPAIAFGTKTGQDKPPIADPSTKGT